MLSIIMNIICGIVATLNRPRLARTTLVGIILTVLPNSGKAEDFPQRIELNNRSIMYGLGKDKVYLLKRKSGPGRDFAAKAIIGQLNKIKVISNEVKQIVNKSHRTRYVGKSGWRIDIFEDGSRVRFSAEDYLDSSANPRFPEEERFSKEKLDELGRRFIKTNLSSVITLQANETIEPISTSYQVDTWSAIDGRYEEKKPAIVANSIKYGRRIGGIDVIGPGSRVEIIFANDETPVGFIYDWPTYELTKKTQDIIGVNEIGERTSALSTMRFQAEDVDIERFECGYWDAGARHQSRNAFIQAGCAVVYVGFKSYELLDREKSAVIDAIPIGRVVEEDESWPHARAIRENGDICRETEISEAAFTTIGNK